MLPQPLQFLLLPLLVLDCTPPVSTSPPTPVARQAANDDVEHRDKAIDDGAKDGPDAVDNGHEAGADGLEDGFDLIKKGKAHEC